MLGVTATVYSPFIRVVLNRDMCSVMHFVSIGIAHRVSVCYQDSNRKGGTANMFWQSVLNGFGVFLHWQTYAVALMYFVVSFLPLIVFMLVGGRYGGCLCMLILPLFQALAIYVSVCTLFPIMLGGAQAAWTLPWMLLLTEPVQTLIILVIMLVLLHVGVVVPILGRADSFIMFLMGGAVLVSLTLTIHKLFPELGIQNIELIPDLLTIIGIVIVSGISSWLGVLAVAAITALLFRGKEDISQFIMMPLVSVFGFIPIFIYAAWIGLQIKGLR